MTNEGSCYSGYWGCAVGTWEAVNDTVHCAPHESYITQLVGVQLTHGDKKLMPLYSTVNRLTAVFLPVCSH